MGEKLDRISGRDPDGRPIPPKREANLERITVETEADHPVVKRVADPYHKGREIEIRRRRKARVDPTAATRVIVAPYSPGRHVEVAGPRERLLLKGLIRRGYDPYRVTPVEATDDRPFTPEEEEDIRESERVVRREKFERRFRREP